MSDFIALEDKAENRIVCGRCGHVIVRGKVRIKVVWNDMPHWLGKFVQCCGNQPKLMIALFSSPEEAERVIDVDIHDERNGYDLLPLSNPEGFSYKGN